MRVEIHVLGGPAAGQQFAFDKPDCLLFGRALDARISLPRDPYVSRHHFLLEIAPPECKVIDLGSKNGMIINGVRYGGRKPPGPGVVQATDGKSERRLADGDEVVVGDTRMRIKVEASVLCSGCGCTMAAVDGQAAVAGDAAALCADCRVRSAGMETLSAESPPPASAAPMAVAATAAQTGPRFAGYQIEGELGRGGMGVVYRAIAQATQRTVAIKTMLPQVALNEGSVRAFQREVDVSRQLTHPNVVELYEHGEAGGSFYFVLEFIDGMDLEKYIQLRGGRIPLEEAAPLMLQILDGLCWAHRAPLTMAIAGGEMRRFTGLVHRDLKPQNILIARTATGAIPKIADFGLAKSFESAGLTDMTAPGQIAGTPLYWPREQITHFRFLCPATDVFSIAAVFYEALTGEWVRNGFKEMLAACRNRDRHPGIADFMRVIASSPPIPLQQRLPTIPTAVGQVIDRALRETEVLGDEHEMRHKLAELRYADAGAFRDALAAAL